MADKEIALHIPGPVPVEPDVLAAMAQQPRQHYGDEWLEYYNTFIGRLREVFRTAGSVYPLPSSGTGGIEAMLSTLQSGPTARLASSSTASSAIVCGRSRSRIPPGSRRS